MSTGAYPGTCRCGLFFIGPKRARQHISFIRGGLRAVKNLKSGRYIVFQRHFYTHIGISTTSYDCGDVAAGLTLNASLMFPASSGSSRTTVGKLFLKSCRAKTTECAEWSQGASRFEVRGSAEQHGLNPFKTMHVSTLRRSAPCIAAICR